MIHGLFLFLLSVGRERRLYKTRRRGRDQQMTQTEASSAADEVGRCFEEEEEEEGKDKTEEEEEEEREEGVMVEELETLRWRLREIPFSRFRRSSRVRV